MKSPKWIQSPQAHQEYPEPSFRQPGAFCMYIPRVIKLERSFQKSKDERHVGKTALRLHCAHPKKKDILTTLQILASKSPIEHKEGQIHNPKGYQETNKVYIINVANMGAFIRMHVGGTDIYRNTCVIHIMREEEVEIFIAYGMVPCDENLKAHRSAKRKWSAPMIYCKGVTLFWGLASDDLSVPYGNNHANEPHLGQNDPLRLASASTFPGHCRAAWDFTKIVLIPCPSRS